MTPPRLTAMEGLMSATFSKDELARLRLAFQYRDAAERVINAARNKVPGQNKTHALRKLLGLCAECGGERHENFHYCDKCRETMNVRRRKNR